jgi:hypothetical protein
VTFACCSYVTCCEARAAHWNLQLTTYSFLQAMVIRSELKQPAPERDGDRMGAIVGLKFIHQILDVEVNRGLGNRQLVRNLLVATAVSNESKNLQFPFRKVVVTKMLGETGCDLGRNVTSASVNRSDHAQ